MANVAQQPKKPAGGGYGRFLLEARDEIKASLPKGHKITDIAKAAGKLWKALPESDKQKYNDLFKHAQKEYETQLEEFKTAGGVLVKKSKRPELPKKPTGGGYGQFIIKKWEEIKASVPDGNKVTEVSKQAREQWFALPPTEKRKYEHLYVEALDKYTRAVAELKIARKSKSRTSKKLFTVKLGASKKPRVASPMKTAPRNDASESVDAAELSQPTEPSTPPKRGKAKQVEKETPDKVFPMKRLRSKTADPAAPASATKRGRKSTPPPAMKAREQKAMKRTKAALRA